MQSVVASTNPNQRYLTKSRFTTALECPIKLRYLDDPRYVSTLLDNEFLAALAEGGHQVGALAKCLFPGGIEIKSVGHDAQVEETTRLLQRDSVVLFEAAFRVGRLFVRVDLLRKHGDVLELYEVKAKSYNPDEPGFVGSKGGITSGMMPYLYDVAFQRHVLRQVFPDAGIRAFLVMPNKAAVCAEERLAQRLPIRRHAGRVSVQADPSLDDGRLAEALLAKVPVDEYLETLEAHPLSMGGYEYGFAEGIEALVKELTAPGLTPRPGAHCRSCEFRATEDQVLEGNLDGRAACLEEGWRVTKEEARSSTILELYGFRSTDKLAVRKRLLRDLEPEDLGLEKKDDAISSSHRRWLQVEEHIGAVDRPFIAIHALERTLAGVTWPLHFIDFETACPALPFHAGRKPYEQLLFQFSHHKLESEDRMTHATQHLADPARGFPNFDTIRALRTALSGDNGTVLHWWDHERTVLGQVRKQLEASDAAPVPDREALIEFIDSLLGTRDTPGRLLDLGRRIVHALVFLPGTGGSSSLKKVLPALLRTSGRLREKYGQPTYGAHDGIPSLNFHNQAWVQADGSGRLRDPYSLLGERTDEPDLVGLEDQDERLKEVANGGAAMVAYTLLQSVVMDGPAQERLRTQMLRYCELDTLAMVMAWEAIDELCR